MEYTVIGAGIIGLYTTWSLIDCGVAPEKITVIAQFLPGDESINYTSPYAGGNFSCITSDDDDTLLFDKLTYMNLGRLQRALGGSKCGLENRPSAEFWEAYPVDKKIASYRSYLKDFAIVEKKDLLRGCAFGISFTSWNFNCPFFLGKFQQYLESTGVKFTRKTLSHITQGFISANTKVVFNCSGIGALSLGGVRDTNVFPTRGQVVVVKAPHIQENRMRWGDGTATYIIPRPDSDGELVLGGFLQKDDWTADTFKEQTQDILRRATELFPRILDKPLVIVRVVCGLRPSRHGGVRIAREVVEDGKIVIHNYGASGYGYQSGLGMGIRAVQLLKGINPKL
ncbi:FAD-dependent oxidoreductase [Cyberlindnera jadinii NRRL Y-1542]|uniref:D-aspartate oxidase n=1 Tax=Cyberlindnera jadinii (strain ATCC 18201 / CBS 1600 / BCRC 20928 / JCM 3617 / NBRC 0987 / NRRL Y-1542) TaxID=983966 RepID=A0A1E4S454_CYBJN|nr:D-aspartate oxidase [Cyberlindnera jadinii NRRL Y-1542]ODV74309.1 D-aspartate oxidase [Cyberlindnera jadinii NRRL Y-1542]